MSSTRSVVRLGPLASLLVTLVVALALLGGVALGWPSRALAQGNTPCDQTDLQNALSAGQSTISFAPGCTIDLTSALTVGAGVDITFDGNGLTLDGQTTSFDIIDVNDTTSSPSTLSLNQVTLEDGRSGVVDADGAATVNLTDSTISEINGSQGIAVGIHAGPVTLTGSTISAVHSGDLGVPAIGVQGDKVAMTNSTITGISSVLGGSTGVYAGSGSVVDSTISDVSGAADGIAGGSVSVTSSILADDGQNCELGVVTDSGYNLSAGDSVPNSCGFQGSATSQDVTDAQLHLLPLGNYGGPTQTIALGPTSIAIDAIPPSVCATIKDPATGTVITTDQRGIDRPQGAGCDVGAYEAPAATLTTTPSSPASSGWFNASQLGIGGTLPVTATFTGLAPDQTASCHGATFTGLPETTTGTGLNQTASGSASLGDGQYAITCGVDQGTTPLGVSAFPAQPVSLKVDTTPPTITLTTPANDASYTPGTTVDANYTCADATSGIATTNGCLGTVANGSPIDTSTAGNHTFTVNAADQAGNTASKSVSYTVSLPAPTLTINGAAPQLSPYWYNLANSPSGVTLTVNDADRQVTGYSCSDTIGTTTTDLPLTLAGTPPVGTAKLGDGIQTLSCMASVGTARSAATTVTIQVDRTPPVANCAVPNQTTWYDHNVSVACSPSDATSGLSSSTPSHFSLTTTVANGTADASASTGSQRICDVAGNCTTTGPFTFKVDLAPPTITSPAAGATYTLGTPVTLTCADVGSGVKTCQVTVTLPDQSTITVSQGHTILTDEIGTYTVTPNTVTDVAGNADTTSFTFTVTYALIALPGNTSTVNQGYFALIRFYPADAGGHDYASRNLTVTSVELSGPNGQTIPFAYSFQLGSVSGTAGYQLSINTRNLALGTWTLKIQIGSGEDASIGSVTFTVR